MIKTPDINNVIRNFFAKNSSTRGMERLWSSKLTHPCERFLIYSWSHWRHKKPFGPDALMRFHLGNLHGNDMVRVMQDALVDDPEWRNVSIERTEVPLPENEYNISGRIDAVMKIPDGEKNYFIPCELKSMMDAVFRETNTLEDMFNSHAFYMQCYPGQLLAYMKLTGAEVGLFVLRCKSSGAFKSIRVDMKDHHEYIQPFLDRALRVKHRKQAIEKMTAREDAENVTALAEQTMPERIAYSKSGCGKCEFLHICMPDMHERPGVVNLIGNAEMDNALKTIHELKDTAKKLSDAEKLVKGHLKEALHELNYRDVVTVLTDNYNLDVKISRSTSYTVPEEIKMKYKQTSTYPKMLEITPVESE